MKVTTAILVLALPLAACSNDMPGDSHVLAGKFGGTDVGVSASITGAVITFGCAGEIRLAHPVILDGAGTFSVRDSMRIDAGERDTLPLVKPALIVGSLRGGTLSFTVDPLVTASSADFGGDFITRRDQPEQDHVCRI